MFAIKRKYHFGYVVLTPEVFGSSKALCGQTVDVVINNQIERSPFAGFVAENNVNGIQDRCSITNIIGFTDGEEPYLSDWQSLSSSDLFEGVNIAGETFLLIRQDKLIRIGTFIEPKKERAKVINIFKR